MRYSLIQSLTNLITEASKLDSLINKLLLSDINAEFLEQTCGKLSIWAANKIIDGILANTNNNEIIDRKSKDFVALVNYTLSKRNVREELVSIMDYIRVGLSGNIKTIKDLNIIDIYQLSKEWHDSLEIGGGSIDYVENNEIIIDFRNEKGEGYYWVDLDTNNSDEECERMGHCGRSSRGSLYSLRRDTKIPGTNHTLNKSFLTAAIGSNVLYQLKGPKNSKPDEKYYKYILPLIYHKENYYYGDSYLIQSFGSEYDSKSDFKLSDLSNQEKYELYLNRPDLFDNLSGKFLLKSMSIPGIEIDLNVDIKIDRSEISDFVRCDRGSSCDRLFSDIIDGDLYEYFENYYDNYSRIDQIQINPENLSTITDFINKKAEESDEDISELSLDEAAEKLDVHDDIMRVINNAYSECESDSYVNHYWNTLKKCLEEYGEIKTYFHETKDNFAVIEVDLYQLLYNVDLVEIEEYVNDYGDNYKSIILEAIHLGSIECPKFYISDYYYADVSADDFNESLANRLDWDLT